MEPSAGKPSTGNMKYLIWLVAGLTISATSYFYLTSEVPGGEMRYQQFIRQTMDRHSFPSANFR
jgi:hypothetical protein